MNATLLGAVTLLLLWIILVFVAHVGSGAVHLLYAVSVVLFARRVLVGVRGFLS